jgi:hypothetical protein
MGEMKRKEYIRISKKDVYFIKETLGQSAIMKNFKIVATYNDFEKAFNRYLRNKKNGIRTIITVRKDGQKNNIGLGEVDHV